jgi:hypothetical protein
LKLATNSSLVMVSEGVKTPVPVIATLCMKCPFLLRQTVGLPPIYAKCDGASGGV